MAAELFESVPSRIEAIHWDGDTNTLVDLMGWAVGLIGYKDNELSLIAGKDGAQKMVPVPIGHWVVRSAGDPTDYWPVDDDYFTAKYRKIEMGVDPHA